MHRSVELVLADCERRADEEMLILQADPAEFQRRVDDFLISVGPVTGRMLHDVAVGANARNILELGTAYGYSTVWLADAARATDGKVHSVELWPRKVDYAREQLIQAGLEA